MKLKIKNHNTRRSFLQKSSGLFAGLGLGLSGTAAAKVEQAAPQALAPSAKVLPNNPLVLFDNFHVGNRRSYTWESKFATARYAGFDGFELVGVDPTSEEWKKLMDLATQTHFKLWGLHWTSRAVIDKNAADLNRDLEKIEAVVAACGQSPLQPYITFSLNGSGELWAEQIQDSGSAKAEERHWQRAYQLVAAFDAACGKYGVTGSLYPHTRWICDTPQAQVKILEGAKAKHIGPAFCAHHWYANKAADDLEKVLKYPRLQQLNYVVLTNGKFNGNNFPATRFAEGEIDMAWMLAQLYQFGYEGPISSQGWAIGGDPYIACKQFVDGITAFRKRFKTQPEMWPLER